MNETTLNYLEKNKDKIREQKRLNYLLNKEKRLILARQWQAANKEKIRANSIKKYRVNPLFKLKTNVKNMIGNSFRNGGFNKLTKTEYILGCSYEHFKQHLESLFEPWMNWDNRGLYNGELNYGWDIDHIIPLASATNEFELIKLNHYTNLQPLCSYTNRVIKNSLI